MDRLLKERDSARDAGDTLAQAIKQFLKGCPTRGSVSKESREKLNQTLMSYCVSQGWNGPACSWAKEIIEHEKTGA